MYVDLRSEFNFIANAVISFTLCRRFSFGQKIFWLLTFFWTTLLSSNQLNRTAVAPSSQCAKNCQSDDQIRIECSRFWTKKFWFTSITYRFLQKSQNYATRKRLFLKLIKRSIKYQLIPRTRPSFNASHPIHLFLIFEKSRLKNQVWQPGFLTWKNQFQKASQAVKIQFVKLDFSKLIFQKSITGG